MSRYVNVISVEKSKSIVEWKLVYGLAAGRDVQSSMYVQRSIKWHDAIYKARKCDKGWSSENRVWNQSLTTSSPYPNQVFYFVAKHNQCNLDNVLLWYVR